MSTTTSPRPAQKPAKRRTPTEDGRSGSRSAGRSPAVTIIVTAILAIVAIYFLVPVYWVIVNATKSTDALFGTNGFWFGGGFQLFENLGNVLTANGGIFPRWALNSLIYSGLGSALATYFAIAAGYAVQFDTAVGWLARLQAAHAGNRLEAELRKLRRYKLLIIDEVGYIPFDSDAANLFFQLVAHRYEQGSILVTSNMPFGRWGEIFADDIVAAAMIDRLVHHAEVLTLGGQSYRTKTRRDLMTAQTNNQRGQDSPVT